MAHIDVEDANAWLEDTKLTLSELDTELEEQIASRILAALSTVFDVSTWTDDTNTPLLVRSLVAMHYAAWVYDKTYADDAESNVYAALLRSTADNNLAGILAGTLVLEEVETSPTAGLGTPSFFPNDKSSANEPSEDFPSDGGPAFMMGSVW